MRNSCNYNPALTSSSHSGLLSGGLVGAGVRSGVAVSVYCNGSETGGCLPFLDSRKFVTPLGYLTYGAKGGCYAGSWKTVQSFGTSSTTSSFQFHFLDVFNTKNVMLMDVDQLIKDRPVLLVSVSQCQINFNLEHAVVIWTVVQNDDVICSKARVYDIMSMTECSLLGQSVVENRVSDSLGLDVSITLYSGLGEVRSLRSYSFADSVVSNLEYGVVADGKLEG